MTFPALDTFADDIEVGHMTWRVYMHLQRHQLDIHDPRVVKIIPLSEKLRIRPASIITALNWLVERGYLIEHDRGWRGVRRFTLAWSRKTTVSQSVPV